MGEGRGRVSRLGFAPALAVLGRRDLYSLARETVALAVCALRGR